MKVVSTNHKPGGARADELRGDELRRAGKDDERDCLREYDRQTRPDRQHTINNAKVPRRSTSVQRL